MKALENLMGAFSVVLVLLNALGGVVAGIWLAILGVLGSIGYGLMVGIGGAILISVAILPGMLLGGPAVMMDKKGIKSGFYLFGFLSAVYTFGVLTAWCLFVLFFFSHRGSESAGVPLLIWSYGAATGPIAYLAQKDMQSGMSMERSPHSSHRLHLSSSCSRYSSLIQLATQSPLRLL